jgi:LPXTG-motif cell wall-anchored protein
VILPPGRVSGIVWIDINKNGKRESKEPLLPGITVTLSSVVSSSSVRSHALSATSAADGSYVIKGVDAGNYTVTAKLSASVGLTKFWDSKGSADWKVPVTVISLGEAKADFAAVGNTTMSGTVVSSSSVNPKNAKVSCTWVGIDGQLGTDDDVVYTATTNSVGAYSIPSTPSGKFSCVAEDAVSGKKSTGSVASIAAGSRGNVSVAALKFGILPETGSSSKVQVWMAFMMLLAGLAVMGTSRRHRVQH